MSDKYHRKGDICHSLFIENKLKCLYKQRSHIWNNDCEFSNNHIFLGITRHGINLQARDLYKYNINIDGGI